MAIRKSIEETVVVDGERGEWLEKCQLVLKRQGFGSIKAAPQLGQVHASYKKLTIWGSIDITLLPMNGNATEMHLTVTANVDNLYTLFRSPTRKILNAFKSGLGAPADQ